MKNKRKRSIFESVDMSMVTMENLVKVLNIEKAAFPSHMRILFHGVQSQNHNIRNYDDIVRYMDTDQLTQCLLDYVECDLNNLILYVGDDWYIFGSITKDDDGEETVEIADWASLKGMRPSSARKFLEILYQYRDKKFEASLRESTSYKVVKNLESRGYITILSDDSWSWGGVMMHSVEFRFNPNKYPQLGKDKNKSDEPSEPSEPTTT